MSGSIRIESHCRPEARPQLRWPADLYLEAATSIALVPTSLLNGLPHGEAAPYRSVLTQAHRGWRRAQDVEIPGNTSAPRKSSRNSEPISLGSGRSTDYRTHPNLPDIIDNLVEMYVRSATLTAIS